MLGTSLTEKETKHFSINPQPVQEVNAKPDKQNDYSARIVNNTDTDLIVKWKVTENTLLKGWDYSICNYGQCLAGIPKSGSMRPIKKGDKGFLNLHINPMNVKGTGSVSFYVFEEGHENEGETITYIVRVKK